MTGPVDYLGFVNNLESNQAQQLSALQQAFAQMQQAKRQKQQDAMAQQEAIRRATLADLQIGALKRENDYQQGLEGAMSNPRTLTSLTQGPVQTMPSLASLGGPSFGPETPQYNGPMIPGVTQQTRTQSPAEAGAEYAMSRGHTEDAAKFISLNETMAKQAALARQYGDVEKAAQIDAATEKMTKAATLLSGWKKAGGTQFAMAQAAKLPDLFGNIDMSKMDAGEDGINKYALPNGQYAVWSDENPGQIHLTAAPKPDAEALLDKRLAAQESAADKRFQQQMAMQDKQISAQDRRMAATLAAQERRAKHGGHGGGLSDEQTQALAAAIGEGRLDPYKINSRNQQILADAALANPGIDLNAAAANLGLARNKDVQMKGAIAETVPPLLQKIVDSGKKLNYSNNQFIGKAQQWFDKVSNDPEFTKYMTLRNDQLLTLGGIMRSNGMTDMAQRLEEEAAHPTMSPRALEGWLSGQMESVEPRLKMYRSIRAGKGAVPGNAQPTPQAKAKNAPRTAAGYLSKFQ